MAEITTSFKKSDGQLTKEKFVRKSLIELYSASDANADIDNIELSDVFTDTAKVVTQFTGYDIDSYTVEIGYDKQEQFVEEERTYDSTLKEYVTRNVIKNRTVTNWQPYSGNSEAVTGTSIRVVDDGDNIDLGDKDKNVSERFDDEVDVKNIIRKGKFRDATEEESKHFEALTEEEHKVFAYDSAGDHLATKLSLPGDRWRNFKSNWSICYADATVYAIDTYKSTFDFAGKKCFVKQWDNEEYPRIYSAGCGKDEEEEKKQILNADPEFQKTAKIYKKGTLGSLGLGVLSLVLSSLSDALQIPRFIGFIGLIVAVVGFIYIYKRYGKKAQAMSDKLLGDNKEAKKSNKIELLNARFSKMGMPPLTEKELERFSSENDHKLTDNYFDPKEFEDEEDFLDEEE